MTALTFTLKQNPEFKLDCSRLTPNVLAGLSLSQIENLRLTNSKNSPQLADFFTVSGADTQNIIFENSSNQLDFIGAGLSQGCITVCGDAGDRLGDSMRRGLILAEGNAGDYAGSRMIAGTLGILGGTGKYTGFAMKRGTILLASQPSLHATIQDCGKHNLPFLHLLFKSFAPNTAFTKLASTRVQRFAGDLACNGNGEILVMLK